MRAMFQESAESRALYDRLSAMKPGERIDYAELSSLIRSRVQDHRGSLGTARRRCKRELRLVFSPVRGVGLLCLGEAEKLEVAEAQGISGPHRATLRTAKTLAAVDFEALKPQDQVRLMVVQTVIAATHRLTQNKSRALIAAKVEGARRELPISETLSLFSRNGAVTEK